MWERGLRLSGGLFMEYFLAIVVVLLIVCASKHPWLQKLLKGIGWVLFGAFIFFFYIIKYLVCSSK